MRARCDDHGRCVLIVVSPARRRWGSPRAAHRLLAALGHLLYCNDAAGSLAVTLGASDLLARRLTAPSTAARDRDLLMQVQLVLPAV